MQESEKSHPGSIFDSGYVLIPSGIAEMEKHAEIIDSRSVIGNRDGSFPVRFNCSHIHSSGTGTATILEQFNENALEAVGE